MRAPLPRSARNGDEREDARQERRPATGRENQEGRASAMKPLLDCGGDEPPVMRSRPRASREGRPVAMRAPLPRSARDDRREDARHERRPATEVESTLYLGVARSSERADACGARAPCESRAARSARASVSSRPSRSFDKAPHEDGNLDRQKRLTGGSAGDVGRRRRAGSGGFQGDREGVGNVRELPDSRRSRNDEGRKSRLCPSANVCHTKSSSPVIMCKNSAPSLCARILHCHYAHEFCTVIMCPK